MVANFVRGALYPVRGLGRILGDFRLLMLSGLPVLTGTLLYLGMGWMLWKRSGDWFDSLMPATRSGGLWHGLFEGIRWILYLGFIGMLVLAALVSFVKVVRIVGAPFFDAMSLRTETLLQPGFRDPGRGPSWLGEVAIEIKKIFLGIFFGILCVGVNLVIPGSGVVLGLYLALYYLPLDFLGYAFGRRGLTSKEVRSFRRRNFGKVWGFATATFLLLLTPILSLVVIPCAVVGGTMLYVESAARRPD